MISFPIFKPLLFAAKRLGGKRTGNMVLLFLFLQLLFAQSRAYGQWPGCVGLYPTISPVSLGVPVQFNWYDDCGAIRNYEIQVLRLYNVDSTKKTPHDITALVDWDQALTFCTNIGPVYPNNEYTASFNITLTEGSGFYIWRMRRIGDWSWAGKAVRWYTVWTPTGPFGQNALVPTDMSSTSDPFCFYYNQFDEHINWVFKRKFQEGPDPELHHRPTRFTEKINYANALLMPEQEQERMFHSGGKIVSSTVNDYLGRPSLKTLNVFDEDVSFGYKPVFTQNIAGLKYTAEDFDAGGKYRVPGELRGDVFNYYDVNNNDPSLSRTEGRGYSRISYYNDGTERPREIAGPGAGLDMNSGHLTRKSYGKPTNTELKKIFGDEAPRAESVLKTFTTDPNGVVNISYTDEAGRVIATCLAHPPSSRLQGVSMDPAMNMSDTLTEVIPLSPTKLLTRATYTFPSPTQLSYLYEMIPKTYHESCLKVCGSCDYRVELTAKERLDTMIYRYVQTVAPVFDTVNGSCGGYYTISVADNYRIPANNIVLAPGTYDVSLTLELKRANPATGRLYIDELVDAMHRKIDTMIYGVNSTGTLIPSNAVKSLDTMLSFVDNANMLGLLMYLDVDTSKPTFQITIGNCETFTLPTVRCNTPECSPPQFAEYMKAEMLKYQTRQGNTFFANALANTGLGGIAYTTTADNMFVIASDQEFNDIITRMVNDGYRCSDLFAAWTKTVQNYLTAQRSLAPLGAPQLTSTTKKFDWWGDFMERVGYRMPLEVRPYSDLAIPASDVRRKPYQYFAYDWGTSAMLEGGFCLQYQGSAPCTTTATPPAAPGWYSNTTNGLMAAANNFPAGNPNTQQFHMFHFYKAVKIMGVTAPGNTGYGVSGSGFNMGTIFNPQYSPTAGGGHSISLMKQQCVDRCKGRMDAIVTDLATSFMDDGLKVEGFDYDLGWRPPYSDTVPLTQLLCLSKSVVEYCKSGCDVTPDSSGYLSVTKANKVKRSLLSSLEMIPSKNTLSTCSTGYEKVPLTPGSNQEYLTYWMNRQKAIQQNTQVHSGSITTPNWTPQMPPTSLNIAPFNSAPCNTAGIPLKYDDYNGYFSLGSPKTYASSGCNSVVTYYRKQYPDSVMVNSEFDVTVTAVLNIALAASDTLRIAESLQAPLTLTAGQGPVGSTNYTVHWVIGPRAAGDTFRFTYTVKAPSTPGTPLLMGALRKFANSVSVLCDNFNTPVTVVNCLGMYYHIAQGDPPRYTICPNVCYSAATCSGTVCVKWVDQVTLTMTDPDSLRPLTCEDIVCETFRNDLIQQADMMHQKYEANLRKAYENNCANPKAVDQLFVNNFTQQQGHYTLYYYDRAGNLIRTNQPKGVNPALPMPASGNPEYKFATGNNYNTIGQVKKSVTPDGGETNYWYNSHGELRLTQSAEQKNNGTYAYTRYDDVGRVIETGSAAVAAFTTADLDNPTWPPMGSEVVLTVYDVPYSSAHFPLAGTPPNGAYQRCLRNRVSYTIADKDGDLVNTLNDKAVTVYSYDAHGNVEHVYQHVYPLPPRMIAYENNIITGKPYTIALRNIDSTFNNYDGYTMNFGYDGDGRLIGSYSSLVDTIQQTLVSYYGYDLANKHQVRHKGLDYDQGIDYTYTLQGWLKAINHTNEADDPTHSGYNGVNSRDAYSEVLHYFDGDFVHPGSPFDVSARNINNAGAHIGPYLHVGLYNGNISAKQEFVRPPVGVHTGNAHEAITGYTYRYDQLGRLKASYFHTFDGNDWIRSTAEPVEPGDYDELFWYDKNGNITNVQRQVRQGAAGPVAQMDDATYTYNTDKNQLDKVVDASGSSGAYEGIRSGAASYTYDLNGNLTSDVHGSTAIQIGWSPRNKINMVAGTPNVNMEFSYDAMGNRVRKRNNQTGWTTYYIYDASNNLLATYEGSNVANSIGTGANNIHVQERYLYGNERVGFLQGPNLIWQGSVPVTKAIAQFEVTDHLGNVRALVKDRPYAGIPRALDADITANYNYYSFGSMQPDRVYNGSNSRHGFNGQERDDEILGFGTLNFAKYWMYDTWTGRRWNLDPVDQVGISNYAAFRNNPILYNDPLGDYSQIGAWWRNKRDGGLGIYKSGDDWGYNAKSKTGEGYASFFGGKGKSDMTFYNRADDVSYRFDRWAERILARPAYKVIGEWNPVVQGTTNLGSSITGRDMTIPAWSEGSKPGANVSGELLSPARRFTTGVNGTTQFIGLGLGGLKSFGTDLLLNAGGDLANTVFNDDNAGNNMKYGIHALKLQQAIKSNDVNGFFEEMIGVMNTNSGQVDNQLKNEQK